MNPYDNDNYIEENVQTLLDSFIVLYLESVNYAKDCDTNGENLLNKSVDENVRL